MRSDAPGIIMRINLDSIFHFSKLSELSDLFNRGRANYTRRRIIPARIVNTIAKLLLNKAEFQKIQLSQVIKVAFMYYSEPS